MAQLACRVYLASGEYYSLSLYRMVTASSCGDYEFPPLPMGSTMSPLFDDKPPVMTFTVAMRCPSYLPLFRLPFSTRLPSHCLQTAVRGPGRSRGSTWPWG